MRKARELLVSFALLSAVTVAVALRASRPEAHAAGEVALEKATFAGGCFWCMEPPFEKLDGVVSVVSGYTGGKEVKPTYKQVARGRTGHAEAVQITFDPRKVTYTELLEVFWRQIDPTDAGGQFVDRGRQYRTGIFVHTPAQRRHAEASKKKLAESGKFDRPVVTEITDLETFYTAEAYHQDFFKKNPSHYKRYRSGSGRDDFIERVWGEEKVEHAPKKRYEKPSRSELEKRLTKLQFYVTQENGTERPWKNEYFDHKQAGIYVDIISGEPLFSSEDKFDSGTGWPSFTRPLVPENVESLTDRSHGMVRTEVRSKHADSHLGHVFKDGPAPTGLRYCINSASLRFVPAEKLVDAGYAEFASRF